MVFNYIIELIKFFLHILIAFYTYQIKYKYWFTRVMFRRDSFATDMQLRLLEIFVNIFESLPYQKVMYEHYRKKLHNV